MQKWLWGTLNAEDGERYDKGITILKQNQQKFVKEVNNHVSLSKQFVDIDSNDIEAITSNQTDIEIYIESKMLHINYMSKLFT